MRKEAPVADFHRYRQALGMNQNQLAQALGASRRTGQRWTKGHASLYQHHYEKLAELLVGKDFEAAAHAARLAGTTLEAMGLVSPPPPVVPFVPFTAAPEDVVDSVVCVAAEAANLTPSAMRPALLAAFTRARRLGLTFESAEKALLAKVNAGAQAAKPGKGSSK
jgi:transcriptional regulator with XRE-family HTH domain